MKGIFEKKGHFGVKGHRIKGFCGYPPMFHTHGEMIYVMKGSLPTVVDGKEHILREGELCLLFPYLTHFYENAPDAEVLLILFDPEVTAFDRLLLSQKPSYHYTDGRDFYQMLDRAVTLLAEKKVKTALGYLNAVIGELLERLPLEAADRLSGDSTTRILGYCAEHFAEEITVRQMAEKLYISESYISKIFSEKLKYGFREYINALRIDKAKSLLEHSDKKIVDVMYECGFRNQSSFNRIFRAACGVSPREYKNGALQ